MEADTTRLGYRCIKGVALAMLQTACKWSWDDKKEEGSMSFVDRKLFQSCYILMTAAATLVLAEEFNGEV